LRCYNEPWWPTTKYVVYIYIQKATQYSFTWDSIAKMFYGKNSLLRNYWTDLNLNCTWMSNWLYNCTLQTVLAHLEKKFNWGIIFNICILNDFFSFWNSTWLLFQLCFVIGWNLKNLFLKNHMCDRIVTWSTLWFREFWK